MPGSGCTCPRTARQWSDDGVCASCGNRVLESQLTPVLLQILCGGTGLALWRNSVGYDDGIRKDGSQKHLHYGVGGKGGADYLGIHDGRFVAVEMKRCGGRHDQDQRGFRDLVERSGGIYALVRNETDARALLERLRRIP